MTDLANVPTTARTDRLRLALAVDAAVTGANAAAYVALGWRLDSVLGVAASTLVLIGVALAAFTAAVAIIASRAEVPSTGAWLVVDANVAWVLASIAVAAVDPFELTTAGTVWVLLQAAVVAAFAAAQARELRQR